MLVVQALSQLNDACALRRNVVLNDGSGSNDRCWCNGLFDNGSRYRRCCGRCRSGGFTRFECCQLRLQLDVFFNGLTPFNDDFVQEVIDLIRVKTFLEPDVLDCLVTTSSGVNAMVAPSSLRSVRDQANKHWKIPCLFQHSRAILMPRD